MLKSISNIALLFVLVIVSSCSDPAANQADDNDLFGKVIDDSSQQGLAGIEVELVGQNMKTATDQDGNYSFETVPNGDYTLLAFSKSHIPNFKAVNKSSDGPAEQEFVLSSNVSGAGDMVQFNVGQAQTISGVQIVFSEVTSDSRCQIGVQCVWEGSGRTALDLSYLGQSARIFIDTNDLNDFSSTVEAFGNVYSLESLLPHPELDTEIDPNDYVLTLKINEK